MESNAATLEGYALQMDGHNTQGTAGSVEIPLGCHVVVSSKNPWGWAASRASAHYGISRDVPRTRYFKFTAKAGHRYVIERGYRQFPDVQAGSKSGGRGDLWHIEVLSLAELDERGALERRYFEIVDSVAPPSC